MKYYQVYLPVFKQGDDLFHCYQDIVDFDSEKDCRDAPAFLACSINYKKAAEICEILSKYASDGLIKIIQAETHSILIEIDDNLPEELKKLVEDEILQEEIRDNEEDYDDEEEESDL